MNPRLVVEVGKQIGAEFEIPPESEAGGILLGRDPFCAIRLFDAQLSRRHCRLTFDGTRIFIKDLRSRNGTKVKGRQIRRKTQLRDGDHINVGGCRLVLKYGEPPKPREGLVARMLPKTPAEQLAEKIDNLEGEQFAGYQVEEKIWQSSLTIIYRASRPEKEARAALKIVRPDARAPAEQKNRFLRGAKNARELDHPHLVRALESGEHLEIPYLAMEYVEGNNLQAMLEQTGQPMKVDPALNMTRQVLAALQHVYEHEFVMRSVRPDNIIVTRELDIKMADYELLKHLPREGPQEATRVMNGGLLVEPSFAAPEFVAYPVETDQRADVFGAGACLFYMLTLAPPFGSTLPDGKPSRAFERILRDPRELNPHTPRSVSEIILKSMSEKPDDRYQTPQEMLAALQQAQQSPQ